MHFLLHRYGIELPTRRKSAGTDMTAYQQNSIGYLPVCNEHIWVDWVMVWPWRVLPIDQQFHFLGCFGGLEPKGNGPRIPMLRVWKRGEQFYLRNYAFSSSN